MKLTILGAQGSGKTTVANLLSKKFNIPVADVGEIIRKRCEHEDDTNRDACVLLRNGDLVPHQFAADVLKEKLQEEKFRNGFIIDGYPRTMYQLSLFDPMPDKVIFLDIDDKLAIERLTKRGRLDDTPEGIKKRLRWYHEETTQVLSHYAGLDKLISIDASGSVDSVILKLLPLI